jgi:protein-S-isoprenylcysteine O-methyltransferase Ste14
LKSTSNRCFVVYPIVIIGIELLIRNGDPTIVPWGVPLLPWGYLQFRLSGAYRTRHGGGGPGLAIRPERIVDSGIYAYTRNPMYLGMLIFMAGLAITFWSLPATVLLLYHTYWFQARVVQDESNLRELFGEAYEDYLLRVNRWIPRIL